MSTKNQHDHEKIREIIENLIILDIRDELETKNTYLIKKIKNYLNYSKDRKLSNTVINRILENRGNSDFDKRVRDENPFIQFELKVKKTHESYYEENVYSDGYIKNFITFNQLKLALCGMLEKGIELDLEDIIFCYSKDYIYDTVPFKLENRDKAYISFLTLIDRNYENLVCEKLKDEFSENISIFPYKDTYMLIGSDTREVFEFIKESREAKRYDGKWVQRKQERLDAYRVTEEYKERHEFFNKVCEFIKGLDDETFYRYFKLD